MNRRPLLLFLALLLSPITRAADDTPVFVVQNDVVATPAGPEAHDPRLVRAADDGPVYLTWTEPANGKSVLRLAVYQPAEHAWSAARTVAEIAGDYAFAAGSDRRLALLARTPSALAATRSSDDGATWGQPAAIPFPPKTTLRTPALLFLPDGRLLAAWTLEEAKGRASLHAGIVGEPASLIDARVSPGSVPALAGFPDGGALLVYRGLTDDGVQDIRTARFHDGAWLPSAALIGDLWKPASPPRDGPVLAARGPHAAVAWFNATDGPNIQVSATADAGRQWLMPRRVDDTAPLGRPSLAMLDDGSTLVSWVERDGAGESVFLRRISARDTLSVPVRLAQGIAGHPRIVRVKDGDATPAQLLLAYTTSAGALATRLITLPDPAKLIETESCDCDPRPEDQRGFALQGRITAVNLDAATVTVAHDEIPGLMKATTTTFKAGPEILAAAQADRRVFARIERLGPDWWLFNLRAIAAP